MKLIIKQSTWSGWSKDHKPEEIKKEYDVNLNEKYVIKTEKCSCKTEGKWVEEEIEIFSFDIIEINDSNIKIRTYQPFSDNKDNTINLNSDKKEFVIEIDEPLKLSTPTMDSGYIFILRLLY